MTAPNTQLAITHIYQALTAQQKRVEDLQADLEFLTQADILLIDVEHATGRSLEDSAHRLQAAQAHQQELQGRLNRATSYWHQQGYAEKFGEPWLRSTRPVEANNPPATLTQTPTVTAEQPPPLPDMNNPSVSTMARYTQEMNPPTINPRYITSNPPRPQTAPPSVRAWRNHAWWMGPDKTEKVPIESERTRSGRRFIPHCPQRYARRGYVAPQDQYIDEVVRQKAAGKGNNGFRMEFPGQYRFDPQFDPRFWERELYGRGDIFGERGGLFESEGTRRGREEEEVGPLGERLNDRDSVEGSGDTGSDHGARRASSFEIW